MKNFIKFISVFLLAFCLSSTFAQTPPPPNNGGGAAGAGNNPVGGGAPIGGGLIILVSAALGYAYVRYYQKKPDYIIEEES